MRSEMPAGQVHKYLSSMIEIGLAEQDPKSGQYRLGPGALRIGLSALSQQDCLETTRSAVQRLCEDLEITGHIAVWGPAGPVIVAIYRRGRPFVTTLGLGVVAPLTHSATGLVHLAFTPAEIVQPVLEAELAEHPIDSEFLAELTKRARDDGSAFVSGSMIPGLSARSFPIFDLQNELACSVTLISSAEDLLKESSPASRAAKSLCVKLSKGFGASIHRTIPDME